MKNFILIFTVFTALLFAKETNRADGAEIYRINCAACHMDDGRGGSIYPGLSNSDMLKTSGSNYVGLKVLQGAGNMFPFCDLLDDNEVRLVVNYVMKNLNNSDDEITLEEVKALRPKMSACPNPSTLGKILKDSEQ